MTDHEDLVRANITVRDRINADTLAALQRMRDRLDNGDTEEP